MAIDTCMAYCGSSDSIVFPSHISIIRSKDLPHYLDVSLHVLYLL